MLGLLQGVTEFLPVSSSGHLALARAALGFEPGGGALFEVFVHLGTALAIMTVFRSETFALLGTTPRLLFPPRWRDAWREERAFRQAVLIVASAIPATILGFAFQDEIEGLFDRVALVGGFLIVTGVILLASRWVRRGDGAVGFRTALVMGAAQAFAMLPGISRSGSTIVAGLAEGADREAVGRFAFLMGLVPIFGAAFVKSFDLGGDAGPGVPALVVGTLIAYASGVFSLKALLSLVARGRLSWFAPYCAAAGVAAVALA